MRPRKTHGNHEALTYTEETPPRQYSSSPGDAAAPLHTHTHGAGAASFTKGHWSDAEKQNHHTNKRGFTYGHLAYKNLTGLKSP